MPTLHRRNGSVKYVPPKRLLEGLRPAVAIPATLFAGLVVIAIAFALHNSPKEQKWVNLKPQASWKPGYSHKGEPLTADPRFLFERALDRARTPTATKLQPDPGAGTTPAAGRTVLATSSSVVIEHAIAGSSGRRFVRSEWSGRGHPVTGVGLNLQRGDAVADGEGLRPKAGAEFSLDVAAGPAPEIRETAPDRELRFAP